jgi:hypothetical protein
MRIHEFEHVVRAAGGVLDTHDIIVVGSQAILSQLPRDFMDQTLQVSRELDRTPGGLREREYQRRAGSLYREARSGSRKICGQPGERPGIHRGDG